jgi:BolA protein
MVRGDQRATIIRQKLESELAAEHVEVIDNSGLHVGHPGAEAGAGHFRVIVVSTRFAGLNRLAAQRLVYRTLGEFMVDDIHALEMRTLTPEEWRESER